MEGKSYETPEKRFRIELKWQKIGEKNKAYSITANNKLKDRKILYNFIRECEIHYPASRLQQGQ